MFAASNPHLYDSKKWPCLLGSRFLLISPFSWRSWGFSHHMGVSENRGAPKSSISRLGCSLTKTIQLLGYPHDYGNPHIKLIAGNTPFSRSQDLYDLAAAICSERESEEAKLRNDSETASGSKPWHRTTKKRLVNACSSHSNWDTYIHTYIHTYMYVYIYIYMHIYI